MSADSSESRPVPPAQGGFSYGRPEELPPVKPPSAGFIVQLFLIPALIVMAVVAVWALFGRLADSGTDWGQLVAELGSGNEHRRWRAAQELAQLIRNDQLQPPLDREPLYQNRQVCEALVKLLNESLEQTTASQDDVLHQEFLARCMGSLQDSSQTLPVLAQAMRPERDVEVRKSALMAVTTIAGEKFDKAMGFTGDGSESDDNLQRKPLSEPCLADAAVLDQLRVAAQDTEPVVRHLAAYALANVSGPGSMEQLKVMLLDGDRRTRANAVMGLARNGVADAVPELQKLLQDVLQPTISADVAAGDETERLLQQRMWQAEQPILARNSLRAARDLWAVATAEQRVELQKSVAAIGGADLFAADVRNQARELLQWMER